VFVALLSVPCTSLAFLIDTTLILPVSARGLLLDTWIIATAVKADGTKTSPRQLSAGAEDLKRFAVARLGDGKPVQFDVYNELGAEIVDHDAIVPRQKVYVVLRNQVLPLGVFQGAPLYLQPIFLFCQRHKCPSYTDGPAWPCLQLSLSVAAQART
jgi:hypothetical protein